MNSAPGLELYESYEGDLQQLLASISKALDGPETREGRIDARKQALRGVERLLDEADEILAQMELEVQGHPSKPKLSIKLRSYKNDLTKRKAETRSMMTSMDRNDLLGGSAHTPDLESGLANDGSSLSQAQAQRSRLLAGTDKLSDGQRRLQESHRIALETEDLGTGILGNLRSQREQLEGTRDTLHTADSSIDKASGTLKKMLRRAAQQRFITIAIIAVLVLLILLVLWSKCAA